VANAERHHHAQHRRRSDRFVEQTMAVVEPNLQALSRAVRGLRNLVAHWAGDFPPSRPAELHLSSAAGQDLYHFRLIRSLSFRDRAERGARNPDKYD
jgi:hypothetical protein